MIPVVRDEKNGILQFPQEIPSKRSNRDIPPRLIFITIALALGCVFTKNQVSLYIFGVVLPLISMLILYELFYRLFYLFEEFHHLVSRHHDSVLLLFLFVFKTNLGTIFTFIISSISWFVVTFFINFRIFPEESLATIFITLIACHFFCKIIDIEESPMRFVKQLENLNGMDYGSGLAYSYYNGYLNIILHDTGTESKRFKELIAQYESENNIELAAKKLFILVPMSGFCPPIVDQSKMEIELAKQPEPIVLHRAGTRDRVYHATIYKIWKNPREKPVYVCAEYATPLLTLYEVLQQNLPGVEYYKKYQNEITTNFYMTVRNLVKKNRHIHDLCEIIYYKDTDMDDHQHKDLDIGTLILNKLETLQ